MTTNQSSWPELSGGGRAKSIAVKENTAYIIGTNDAIYKHENNRWIEFPGWNKGKVIAVGNAIYRIGLDGKIYVNPALWTELPGSPICKSLTVYGSIVYVISVDDRIYKFDGTWSEVSGGGRANDISISEGNIYIIGTDAGVYTHYNGWVRLTMNVKAKKLTVTRDTIYIIGMDDIIYQRKIDSKGTWLSLEGEMKAKDITVDDDNLFIIGIDDKMYKYNATKEEEEEEEEPEEKKPLVTLNMKSGSISLESIFSKAGIDKDKMPEKTKDKAVFGQVEKKPGVDTLDFQLLENQNFPLTELLLAMLPKNTTLPPFIPNANLEDLSLSLNPDKKTFDFSGTLKSEWEMPWGFSGLKATEISLAIKREIPEDETEPQLSIGIGLKSETAFKVMEGLTFEGFEVGFEYTEGGDWKGTGGFNITLLDAKYESGIELSKGVEKDEDTKKESLVWALEMASSQKGTPLLTIKDVVQLSVPKTKFKLASSTPIVEGKPAGESTWSFGLDATGKMQLDLVKQLKLSDQPYEFEGKLSIQNNDELQQIKFEIKKGDIEIPLPIPGQNIKYSIGLAELVVTGKEINAETKENEGPSFSIKSRVGLKNLPKPFSDVFPDSVEANLKLSEDGVEFNVGRLLKPVQVSLPPTKVGAATVDLGALLLDATNFTFKTEGEKLITSIDLGLGLPNTINNLFGTDENNEPLVDFFRTVEKDKDGKLEMDTFVQVRMGIDSDGGFFASLMDAPFNFINLEERDDKSWIVCDFGAAGGLECQVPTMKYDGYQFAATGAMKITEPLQIPMQPLKSLLEAQGEVVAAAKIPQMLPLRSINVIDENNKLQVTKLSKYLQDLTGIALPQEFNDVLNELEGTVNRLPADLLEYFRFEMPKEFEFDIAVTIDGGAKIKFKSSEPIKILTVTPAGLIGIRLRSFTFGEIFAGSLFLMSTDVDFDVFNPANLAAALIPTDKIGLKGLVDTHHTRNRLYINDLTTFIAYQAGFPVPIPMFYDGIGVDIKHLDGTALESNFQFPMPKLNAMEMLTSIQDFTAFLSNPEHLLDTTVQNRKMDLSYTIGQNYIQLPKWLDANQTVIGKKDTTLTISAYNRVAALMNAVKTMNPVYLITAIPLNERVNQIKFNLLGIDANGTALLTTTSEFEKIAHQKLNINPADAKRIVSELLPFTKIVTDKEGFVSFAQGSLNIANVGSLYSRIATIGGEKGLANNISLSGKLGTLLDLSLNGNIALNLNPNANENILMNGNGSLKVFGADMFNIDWTASNKQIALKAEAFALPIAGVNLSGSFDGHLNSNSFAINGQGQLTVDGLGEPFGHVGLHLSTHELRLTGKWLDQEANFRVMRDNTGMIMSASLAPIHIGDNIMNITSSDKLSGAKAFISSLNGVPKLYIDGAVEIPMLQLDSSVRVDFSPSKCMFRTKTTVLEKFTADIKGEGVNLIDANSFRISGVFENNFLNWIHDEIIKLITQENAKNGQNIQYLRNEVTKAQGNVNHLLGQVNANRQTVQNERNQRNAAFNAANADLQKAQNNVNSLDGQIVNHQRWYNALSDWDKFVNSAPYGVKQAALATAKATATAALSIARTAVNGVKSGLNFAPIDLDPRVSVPLAAHGIATIALAGFNEQLRILQEGLGVLGNVATFIVNAGAGAIINVNHVSFDAALSVLRGDELPVKVELEFMHNQKTLDLILDLDEPHKFVVSLFNSLTK